MSDLDYEITNDQEPITDKTSRWMLVTVAVFYVLVPLSFVIGILVGKTIHDKDTAGLTPTYAEECDYYEKVNKHLSKNCTEEGVC